MNKVITSHRRARRELTRRRKASAQVNRDAFQVKRDLLGMYETMGVENDYVRELRKRVQDKRCQLQNRGVDCE